MFCVCVTVSVLTESGVLNDGGNVSGMYYEMAGRGMSEESGKE